MLLLLILCLCTPTSPQISTDPTVVAVRPKGDAFLPCGKADLPLRLDWHLEGDSNDTWLSLELNYTIQEIEFISPMAVIIKNLSLQDSGEYSCSTGSINDTDIYNIEPVTENHVLMRCRAPEDWTLLSWHKGKTLMLTAKRGKGATRLHTAVLEGETFLYIPSATWKDTGTYNCIQGGNESVVLLNVTGHIENTIIGFDIFFKEQYWIIIAVTLGYVSFCSLVICCYLRRRRKRKARREAKNRFFKVSTARNLYTDSTLSHEQGERMRSRTKEPEVKLSEITYQNVKEVTPNGIHNDQLSENSSFLDVSGDEDSYLEPNAEDKVSEGDCYENAKQEIIDKEGSEDGDCYENASEEIKDGSEGSQSYEDMKGSIYIKSETEQTPNEKDEDADSYENMQTPIYALPNHSLNSLNKPAEEQPASVCQDKSPSCSLSGTPLGQRQRTTSELTKINGDFYMSYESSKA
ncbi:B-lymphocyte antigen CD19 [Discoglossus pictus]